MTEPDPFEAEIARMREAGRRRAEAFAATDAAFQAALKLWFAKTVSAFAGDNSALALMRRLRTLRSR
jgi:hypothetical protein